MRVRPAPATICGTVTPPGLAVVEVDGVQYLCDLGPTHTLRVFGWYYGYPACCVEAFVARDEQQRARHHHETALARCLSEPHDADEPPPPAVLAEQLADMPPLHPISGHLLCAACAAGPKAMLPPRPAELYGFAHETGDDEQPVSFEPPSRYHPPAPTRPSEEPRWEQLAIEGLLA
jgi:hypothetical protein